MLASAEFLWRMNLEYANRLARARHYLDLLEQLMQERGSAEPRDLLATLRFTRTHLDSLSEEHRGWCYTYFYESPESKRMVHAPRDVRRALTNFCQMRDRQAYSFHDLAQRLYRLPRPAALSTQVPNGDLWDMMQHALHDLVDFSAAQEARASSSR